MPPFVFSTPVRFADVDHAGIVYYPRFFHYFHLAFEELFRSRMGPRAYVELLHGETYRLAASPGVEVAIDREPARPGLVRLTAGRHEVTWRGTVGAIELTTLPCAERASVLP